MKKSLAVKFAFLQGCNLAVLCECDCESSLNVESKLDIILNEIFSVDPISGFPKGDITYYLTGDGNQQVKDWIQRNLLQPRSILSGDDPSKVSDDLINEFSRQFGETNEQYASRLLKIRLEAEENLSKFNDSND